MATYAKGILELELQILAEDFEQSVPFFSAELFILLSNIDTAVVLIMGLGLFTRFHIFIE